MIEISRVFIPKDCLVHTYDFLRRAGRVNLEGVTLWAGEKSGNDFYVNYSLVPKQDSYQLEGGLLYSVGGEELHRINQWLHEKKQQLIAQIHSHPGEAYHSETDDAYPVVTKVGSLSIVIPDFAAGKMEKEEWAVYRLHAGTGWQLLSEEEVEALINLE